MFNARRNDSGAVDINIGPTAIPPASGAPVMLDDEELVFMADEDPPAPGRLLRGVDEVCVVGVVKTGTRIRSNGSR